MTENSDDLNNSDSPADNDPDQEENKEAEDDKEAKKEGKEGKVPYDMLTSDELRDNHKRACDFLGSEGAYQLIRKAAREGTEALGKEEKKELKKVREYRTILTAVEKELESRDENTDKLKRGRETVTTVMAEKREEDAARKEMSQEEINEADIEVAEKKYERLLADIDRSIASYELVISEIKASGPWNKIRDFSIKLSAEDKQMTLTSCRQQLIAGEVLYWQDRRRLIRQGASEEDISLLDSIHKSKTFLLLEGIAGTGSVHVGDELLPFSEIGMHHSAAEKDPLDIMDELKDNLGLTEEGLTRDTRDLEITLKMNSLLPDQAKNSDELLAKEDKKAKKIIENYEKKMGSIARHIANLQNEIKTELKKPGGGDLYRINYLSSVISEAKEEADEYREKTERKIIAFGFKNRLKKLLINSREYLGDFASGAVDSLERGAGKVAGKVKESAAKKADHLTDRISRI